MKVAVNALAHEHDGKGNSSKAREIRNWISNLFRYNVSDKEIQVILNSN